MKKGLKAVLISVMALGTLGCSAKPSASEDHLTRIKAAGKITVALEGAWKPFGYHDEESDKLIGFDVEVAENIAKDMGVEVEFVEGDFDGGLTGVSTGVYDMMVNGVDVTEERKGTFDFTDPYAYDRMGLVTRIDETDITTFEDLKGKKTANSMGSTYMAKGEEMGAEVLGADTLAETMELVLNGKADATINAQTSIIDYMTTTHEKILKVVAVSEEATPYAIPLKKGADNDTFRAEINKIIAAMKSDGRLSELSIKYFGEDLTKE